MTVAWWLALWLTGAPTLTLPGQMKTHVAVARRSVGRCSALYKRYITTSNIIITSQPTHTQATVLLVQSCSNSISTIALTRDPNWEGVLPVMSRALTSAPWSSNNRTTWVLPMITAQ